ncbi:hypothetical protein LY76DRAFT_31942 [Colletotrichum caudatum]|nr:hypothetical protein LY76DRAFT_31942 [Colletotrichum caudatum]
MLLHRLIRLRKENIKTRPETEAQPRQFRVRRPTVVMEDRLVDVALNLKGTVRSTAGQKRKEESMGLSRNESQNLPRTPARCSLFFCCLRTNGWATRPQQIGKTTQRGRECGWLALAEGSVPETPEEALTVQTETQIKPTTQRAAPNCDSTPYRVNYTPETPLRRVRS